MDKYQKKKNRLDSYKKNLKKFEDDIRSRDLIQSSDLDPLFHELQTYHTELEYQNDELFRSQNELEKVRQKYFDLFNFVPVGYVTLDQNGVIKDSNRTFLLLIDKPADQILEHHFFPLIEPAYQNIFISWMKNKRQTALDIQMQHKTRGSFWVNIKNSIAILEPNPEGSHNQLMLLIINDVHEIHSSRKRLQDALDHLNTAIEVANLAWWRMDVVTGKVTFHSKKAQMLGYPEQKFLDKTYHAFTELIHQDDYEKAMSSMRNHISGQTEAYEVEYRIQHSSGHWRWFYDFGKITDRSLQGQPQSITGIVMDVTDRNETNAILKESENKFRSIFYESALGMVICTLEGKFVQVNNSFCNLVGYNADELLSMDFQNITYPDDIQLDLSMALDLINGKAESYRLQKRYIHKSGNIVWIDLTVSLHKDSKENPIFFIGQIQDITNQKQIEEQLTKAATESRLAAQAKGQFLANMSHEIRTPMNGVLGMLGILRDSDLLPDQRQFVELAYQSASGLLTILNDILDYSKIEAGKLLLDHQPFSIHKLTSEVISMLRFPAQEKNLDFGYESEIPEETLLVGDEIRVRQILMNLASNAIKFTDRGSVRIHSFYRNGILRLEVHDTGIGISADKIDDIFGLFEQADISITRKYGGTGLGLSISQQLAQMMHGQISATSQENKGSIFTFEAPFPEKKQEELIPNYSVEANLYRSSHPQFQLVLIDNKELNTLLLQNLELQSCFFINHVNQVKDLDTWMVSCQSPANNSLLFVLTDEMIGQTPQSELLPALPPHLAHCKMRALVLAKSTYRGQADVLHALGYHGYAAWPLRLHQLWDLMCVVMQASKNEIKNQIITLYWIKNFGAQYLELRIQRSIKPKSKKNLLVEDNTVNQIVTRKTLEKLKFEIDIANHGAEAVKMVQEKEYDLVFMDIQMPVMDGFTASIQIRNLGGRHLTTPIVAMTAGAMQEDRDKALEAGMNAHISKPLVKQELMLTLHRFLSL